MIGIEVTDVNGQLFIRDWIAISASFAGAVTAIAAAAIAILWERRTYRKRTNKRELEQFMGRLDVLSQDLSSKNRFNSEGLTLKSWEQIVGAQNTLVQIRREMVPEVGTPVFILIQTLQEYLNAVSPERLSEVRTSHNRAGSKFDPVIFFATELSDSGAKLKEHLSYLGKSVAIMQAEIRQWLVHGVPRNPESKLKKELDSVPVPEFLR